jgi:hypothetical protein
MTPISAELGGDPRIGDLITTIALGLSAAFLGGFVAAVLQARAPGACEAQRR